MPFYVWGLGLLCSHEQKNMVRKVFFESRAERPPLQTASRSDDPALQARSKIIKGGAFPPDRAGDLHGAGAILKRRMEWGPDGKNSVIQTGTGTLEKIDSGGRAGLRIILDRGISRRAYAILATKRPRAFAGTAKRSWFIQRQLGRRTISRSSTSLPIGGGAGREPRRPRITQKLSLRHWHGWSRTGKKNALAFVGEGAELRGEGRPGLRYLRDFCAWRADPGQKRKTITDGPTGTGWPAEDFLTEKIYSFQLPDAYRTHCGPPKVCLARRRSQS